MGRRIKRERIFTAFSLLNRLQITFPENRILRMACLGFLTRFVVLTVGITVDEIQQKQWIWSKGFYNHSQLAAGAEILGSIVQQSNLNR